MANNTVRVRFAPAPTGMMHLGNIRIALLNYLFAKQKQGSFVLRIEDTDPERNFDLGAVKIRQDLQWLHLHHDEGPGKAEPYKPYFQSERTHIYQEKLNELIDKKSVYRCFCTPEELEKKRQRQIALKMPPRYDRTCLAINEKDIEQKLSQKIPFVWRFKIPTHTTITIHDLAKGAINFDMSHFSDYPVTRTNSTFTFLFSNGIDDMAMKITHVLRGEDHLSNTANQAAIFVALEAPIPLYWHLPILCNIEGKKLSKRDFGFSLRDLKVEGFLPEAINNYLAIIGGSFEHEIMNMDDMIKSYNFETIHQSGSIKYDVDKLKWVNHKWIERYNKEELANLALPFLEKEYPEIKQCDYAKIVQLLQTIKSELITLHDSIKAAAFYFNRPSISAKDIAAHAPLDVVQKVQTLIAQHLNKIQNTDAFLQAVKTSSKEQSIPPKHLYVVLRMMLMGQAEGPAILDILNLLGPDEAQRRLTSF